MSHHAGRPRPEMAQPRTWSAVTFCAYRSEIVTVGVCAPPTDARSETSPEPRPAGTVKLSWYRPALVSPAKDGVTLTLLMVSVTGFVVAADPVNRAPAGTAGFVGPNPTPKSSTVSPALA